MLFHWCLWRFFAVLQEGQRMFSLSLRRLLLTLVWWASVRKSIFPRCFRLERGVIMIRAISISLLRGWALSLSPGLPAVQLHWCRWLGTGCVQWWVPISSPSTFRSTRLLDWEDADERWGSNREGKGSCTWSFFEDLEMCNVSWSRRGTCEHLLW